MPEQLIVTCACGFEVTGEPDEVVAATQQHGREVHNMNATPDEVLAMARPAGEAPRATQR